MGKRFNLDAALAAWRRPYEVSRTFSADDLEELEGALLDRYEGLLGEGRSDDEAFHEAVRRMGHYGTMERGFLSVYWGKARRERTLGYELNWRGAMLKNYLTIGLRALRKQWGYTLINVGGLALGLASVILIGLYLHQQLSYDTFHADADQIYRVYKEDPGSDYLGNTRYAVTPAPLAPRLTATFPEVISATHVEPTQMVLTRGDRRVNPSGLLASPSFFDVFSFELLQGTPGSVLSEPRHIVLTPTLVAALFGDVDPVDQVVTLVQQGERQDLTVAGVIEAPPANSHMQFAFLASLEGDRSYQRNMARDEWDSSNYYTYALLREDAVLPTFREKLAALAHAQLSSRSYYQDNPDRISVYHAQPLLDIHLHSRLNFELEANGDIRYVYLFAAIGLLILLIACINYTNLATARSVLRAKEVGVRKVMGAHRSQLVGQFMSEAVLLCGSGVLLAVGLAWAVLPLFNTLTGITLTIGSASPLFWGGVLVAGLLAGLLAGVYPALVLSGFAPVGIMKGVLRHQRGKVRFRNLLVVGQFAVTVVLMAGTLVIYQQLQYVQETNTGLDREHVATVFIRAEKDKYPAIKEQMLQHPNVVAVSAAAHNPTRIVGQSTATAWEGAQEGDRIAAYNSVVQPGYIDLLGLKMVAGRDFSEERPADEREGYIINETMARQLGWDDAIGKWFDFQGREGRIIGVVEDFNFLSFRQEVGPLLLYVDDHWFSRILVKMRGENVPTTLAHLEATMAGFVPDYPFEHAFLDDTYARMYASDLRVGYLISTFAVLAVLIACLGLVGLAAFTTAQRTKEIGVRKVLGASARDVIVLLSKEVTWLVLVALGVGLPVAYYGATVWLQGFAYRIALDWTTFAGAGLLLVLLAWGAVSYQAIRAAWSNPVEALRQE